MNITLHTFNHNNCQNTYQDIPIKLSHADDIRIAIDDDDGESMGEFHIQLLDDSSLGLSLDTNGVSVELRKQETTK